MDEEDIIILRFYLALALWDGIEKNEKLIPYETGLELGAEARERLTQRQSLGIPNSNIAAEDFIDETIKDAREGDTAAARKVLEEFCACVKSNTDSNGNPYSRSSGIGNEVITNTQIDERIIRYLAECFEKIITDAPSVRADANHALNLVKAGERGRKKTQEARQASLNIGYEVMERHREIKAENQKTKLRGSDSPLDRAIKDIAEKHSKSFQTVKDAYDEFNNLFNRVVEEAKQG